MLEEFNTIQTSIDELCDNTEDELEDRGVFYSTVYRYEGIGTPILDDNKFKSWVGSVHSDAQSAIDAQSVASTQVSTIIWWQIRELNRISLYFCNINS